MNLEIKYLSKTEIINLLNDMYEIISNNMKDIIDTGNSDDENYMNWKNSMYEELTKSNKKWVGAFENKKLIGYFLYKINSDFLNIDEIQIVKEHQGDGYTFKNLLKTILNEKIAKTEFKITTYVNKSNEKSNAIVKKLGFTILEVKERGIKYVISYNKLLEKLKI